MNETYFSTNTYELFPLPIIVNHTLWLPNRNTFALIININHTYTVIFTHFILLKRK